ERGVTTAQLAEAVTTFVAQQPSQADAEARAWEERRGWMTPTPRGGQHLQVTLDPVGGEIVATTLAPLAQPRTSDDPRTSEQRFADAVVEMARIALASGELPDHELGSPELV